MWNAKENSLFKDEWVLQFTSLLRDIPALWYQLLQLRDTQAPKIWGQPKVHQAPPRATSAETQQCSGTLMKFTYDKPSISQQVRTSSSHLIPPSSEFVRLQPSWTPCPPHLQLFHFFLLLLSGREGLGHGGTGSVSIQVHLRLPAWYSVSSAGTTDLIWGFGISDPSLLLFLPSMGFLLRNHLYFTP